MNRKWFTICAATAAIALGAASALAQTTCPPLGTDADNDGFDDSLECAGIPLASGTRVITDGATKDVFVIVALASNSLVQQVFGTTPFNPFNPASYLGSGVNVAFNGLTSLGVNVHPISDADIAATVDRVVDASGVSLQKAVRIAESTDTNGTILGNCQWGTPDGLDGCVVYSQRIKNFIDSTCPGNTDAERALMFKAYVTESFLHEVGHSMGGLAPSYNSRNGGYHYKSGSGFVMEQSVTYSNKNGTCTWYISSSWNPSYDPPSVRLK